MPKSIAPDFDMPRRRRGTAIVAVMNDQRSLAMRLMLNSPKDIIAAAVALAAVAAIIVNATFMQESRHPSPIFGAGAARPVATAAPANPIPRPRPVEAEMRVIEPKAAEMRAAEPRIEPRPADPVGNLVKATSSPAASSLPVASTSVARPPAPIPTSSRRDGVGDLIVSSRRVAAVQRALTDYGYGQLKPTGVVGSDTQAAIQKFEKERRLPVTGQMSDRLVRELAAATGRAVN